MSARALALAVTAAVAAVSAPASPAAADPYRLRADALAQAQSPVGLLVLRGQDRLRPWLDAEAVVWAGASGDDAADDDGAGADALAVSVRARAPGGRAELRAGRQVAAVGALRPVHVDGAVGRVRLPWRFAAEAFGGVPVVPRFGVRAGDWLAGGRVARGIGDWGAAGVAYAHQRAEGRLAYEELAADAAVAPTRSLHVAGRAALDLVHGGLAETHLSLGARRGAMRGDLFAVHRSPARLVPATSLFSVLGDVPSRAAGATVAWRAAPRLDLLATAAARAAGDEVGADATARATLRLDDAGAGAVSLELRRQGAGGGWTGARAAARVPWTPHISVAGEVEVAAADDPRDRGAVWPWALAAVTWHPAPSWEIAAAVEASASPEHRRRADALVRIARGWGAP
jgi:hypothetical protein